MSGDRSYNVAITADVVDRRTVKVVVAVEADDAKGAVRKAWAERVDLIAPVVPDGYAVASYSAETR